MVVLFIWLFLMLWTGWAEAATWTSPSCRYEPGVNTDVLNTINLAADGDTVQLPAGTCNWTGSVTVSNKSITIQGVGQGTDAQCSVIGQSTFTCLRRGAPLWTITTKSTGGSPAGAFTLKNMTIQTTTGATGCNTYGIGGTTIGGTSSNVRITGVRFIYSESLAHVACGGVILNNVFGVMDHSYITDQAAGTSQAHGIVVRHSAYLGVGLYGDNSWAQASTMGGSNVFVIEDNQFDCNPGTASYCDFTDHFLGGRYVVRNNTINNGRIQNHGTESGGRQRSARHGEIYRNRFTQSLSLDNATMMASRGGTGRWFDNAVSRTGTGNLTRPGDFNTYRAAPGRALSSYWPWAFCQKLTPTSITSSAGVATVTTSTAHGIQAGANAAYMMISGADQAEYNKTAVAVTGISTTQFSYAITGTPVSPATGTLIVASAFDGNTDSAGYPCIDQIGRGAGVLLSGDIPTMTNAGPVNQVLDPLYCFNNTVNGTVSSCQPSASGSVIIENRDYFNSISPFTGAAGVGRGFRINRPSSPTVANVAYWSTNGGTNWNTSTTDATFNPTGVAGEDGCLDIWNGSQWVDCDYTPLPYPHSLVSGSTPPTGPDITPPAAPTGIQVTER